jgi:hypothetical protein
MLNTLKAVKKLTKKEQKKVTGGACNGGLYPMWCACLKRRVCPDYCPC